MAKLSSGRRTGARSAARPRTRATSLRAPGAGRCRGGLAARALRDDVAVQIFSNRVRGVDTPGSRLEITRWPRAPQLLIALALLGRDAHAFLQAVRRAHDEALASAEPGDDLD